MSESELRTSLAEAKIRLQRATQALAPKHKGGEFEEYLAAHEALLIAQRNLAAHRGEEYATPVAFPVQWDVGAPLPHLVQNDNKTFLLFYLSETVSQWDGLSVTAMSADASASVAIVEFVNCRSAKMGAPNDEAASGHALHGKGFIPYRPLKVENSLWIRELEQINSVHPHHDPASWKALSHYILGFHDCTFECVARSFSVETTVKTMREALHDVCDRL